MTDDFIKRLETLGVKPSVAVVYDGDVMDFIILPGNTVYGGDELYSLSAVRRLVEDCDRYRTDLLQRGACPSCLDGAPCWDCQNTGWSGGDPSARAEAAEARLKEAEAVIEPFASIARKAAPNYLASGPAVNVIDWSSFLAARDFLKGRKP